MRLSEIIDLKITEASKPKHRIYSDDEHPDMSVEPKRQIYKGKSVGINQVPEKFHKAGVVLYHGTWQPSVKKVLAKGLKPKLARHGEDALLDAYKLLNIQKIEIDYDVLKTIPMIYCADAPDNGWIKMFPYYFTFTTIPSDVLGVNHNSSDEWVVFNRITPDRLTLFDHTGKQIEI